MDFGRFEASEFSVSLEAGFSLARMISQLVEVTTCSMKSDDLADDLAKKSCQRRDSTSFRGFYGVALRVCR